MKFDIAVVNYNTDFYVLNLVASLHRAFPAGFGGTCHVWDNGSTDASRAVLAVLGREISWLEAHLGPVNLLHGPALDRLLREHCRAEWVLVLDSDTRVRHDFRSVLPSLTEEAPAFIGQIHPEVSRLYAYMCHLLVNRRLYLELPPFDQDGGPGRRFFRAVAERGLHWRRFRWVDHVEHYGQGTLHGVVARRDVTHPFYGFAEDQSRRNPHWLPSLEQEQRLRETLGRFLAEHGVAATRGAPDLPGSPAAAGATIAPAGRGTPGRLPPPVRPLSRREAFHPSPAARLVRIATRLGLPPCEAELRRLVRLLRWRRPQTVLELGRPAGGTLFLWTRVAAVRATLVSAGLPPWELDDPGEEPRRQLLRTLARRRQDVRVLREDPLAPGVEAQVRTILAGRRLDFVFIIGEDDEERVRACLDAYAPLAAPGSLVALDGIRPRLGEGVRLTALWQQVQDQARTQEIVADRSRPGAGIGLIHVDERPLTGRPRGS